MRVAIITPFHSEPEAWLAQCHRSVLEQTVPCDHFMVGDGTTVEPPPTALHIALPRNVADFGDTPRAIGSLYAAGLGYDAVLYLDADNWFHPTHVESILQTRTATGADIVSSRRMFVRLDGSPMATCTTSDGERFCDTNCLAVFRPAFEVLAQWALMDPALHPIDDRVIWRFILDRGFSRAHTGKASVFYRATHAGFYLDLGESPPPEAKQSVRTIGAALQKWADMGFRLPLTWGYVRRRQGSDADPGGRPPGNRSARLDTRLE